MSRTATATPPSPYFPPRNATPTMRHCSTPMVTAAHFTHRSGHHHAGKRRTKNLPSSLAGLGPSSAKKAVTEALGLSYEEIPSPRTKQIQSHQGNQPTSPTESFASHATSAPAESYGVLSSEKSLASSIDDSPREQRDDEMDRSTPTPSMSTSGTVSFSTTPLPTPSNSRAPSLSQQEGVIADTSLSGLGLVFNGESPVVGVPLLNAPTASRASWVPNLGKMAKAVVNSGMSMGMSFAEKRSKKEGRNALPQQAESAFAPSQPLPKPPAEELHQFSEDEAMDRRREWAAAEQRGIAEFAVLCSQWPHSGYNIAKWGPNGELFGLILVGGVSIFKSFLTVVWARRKTLLRTAVLLKPAIFREPHGASSGARVPDVDHFRYFRSLPTCWCIPIARTCRPVKERGPLPPAGFTECVELYFK